MKLSPENLVVWNTREKPNSHPVALKLSVSSKLVLLLGRTYPWQLGYYNSHDSQKIDDKVRQVIMRVVSTEKEKHNWYAQEELFSRRVLVTIVDLLPHVQIVVRPSIELEWYASDPVKHQIGPEHVDDVGECP